MAAPQVTGRKITRQARAPPLLERAAYTIREFCDAHRISKSTYYNLRKQDLGPDEARVRDRVIITMEAAARWRKARERATAPKDQPHRSAVRCRSLSAHASLGSCRNEPHGRGPSATTLKPEVQNDRRR